MRLAKNSSGRTSAPRFIMLGGFLGAGKTTTVLRLAHHLQQLGFRPGIITNDQATGLVDTALVDQLGLPVQEIAGGCFCCRSESLVEALNRLEADLKPDVFIAEPVGSCTDLVATVSKPLIQIYGKKFVMAPYAVLVDPFRAERVLEIANASSPVVLAPITIASFAKNLQKVGVPVQTKSTESAVGEMAPTPQEFAQIQSEMQEVLNQIGARRAPLPTTNASCALHDDVHYIYKKQLEEAEIIVLNKIDLINGARLAALRAAMAREYPRAAIMEVSSREGRALEPLFVKLVSGTSRPQKTIEVDYERYGRGEAMLGWLNATVTLHPHSAFEGYEVLAPVAISLRDRLLRAKIEIAHLKIILRCKTRKSELLRMQMTSTGEAPAFAGGLKGPVKRGELLINLRAEGDPQKIGRLVKNALRHSLSNVPHQLILFDAFRPGQPVPLHRVT